MDFIKDFHDRFAFGEASGLVVFDSTGELVEGLAGDIKAVDDASDYGLGDYRLLRGFSHDTQTRHDVHQQPFDKL